MQRKSGHENELGPVSVPVPRVTFHSLILFSFRSPLDPTWTPIILVFGYVNSDMGFRSLALRFLWLGIGGVVGALVVLWTVSLFRSANR